MAVTLGRSIQTIERSIDAGFEAEMAEKAHGYCAKDQTNRV
jgi:hypothetical protein